MVRLTNRAFYFSALNIDGEINKVRAVIPAFKNLFIYSPFEGLNKGDKISPYSKVYECFPKIVNMYNKLICKTFSYSEILLLKIKIINY